MFTKVLILDWIHDLSNKVYILFISHHLAKTQESFDSLWMHMLDVVGLAQDWIAGEKSTPMDASLLQNLVEVNMSNEEGNRHLSDDELLSNIFVRPFLPPWKNTKYWKEIWFSRFFFWQAMVFVLGGIDTNEILTENPETSAHTICFVIILLALHPDIQEWVYKEAR